VAETRAVRGEAGFSFRNLGMSGSTGGSGFPLRIQPGRTRYLLRDRNEVFEHQAACFGFWGTTGGPFALNPRKERTMRTPERKPEPDCDNVTQDANNLIDKLQDIVAEQLPPNSAVSSEDAYNEIIHELEAAPEVEEIRHAGGRDPDHFGSED
jgi:hypothetical protein